MSHDEFAQWLQALPADGVERDRQNNMRQGHELHAYAFLMRLRMERASGDAPVALGTANGK